jgi:BirA family transcriptional regulator, biotin operon repressor / biotin---[acetyl-CoA-carboxylase] ligase
MTTREAVLARLRDAGAVGVSGEVLAADLGVSRVAVAKHVTALRAEGYAIDATPGTGYTLSGVPDAPVPREVARLLRSGFWTQLDGGGETASTNDDARALASGGAPEGSVVLASRQLSGRGRLGRTWESPVGGAYFSAVLRPRVTPAETPSIALAIALGIAEGLETLGVQPALKWPNDVLLSGGKLAGVLLEMAAEADGVSWVIAGVGLNVRHPESGAPGAPAVPAAPSAAYLRDESPASISEVTAAVLDGVAAAYGRWLQGGFAPLRSAYEQRLALVGESVRVSDLDGTVRAEGMVLGVDDAGRLLVDSGHDVVAVVAGEVTLRA